MKTISVLLLIALVLVSTAEANLVAEIHHMVAGPWADFWTFLTSPSLNNFKRWFGQTGWYIISPFIAGMARPTVRSEFIKVKA